MYNIMLFDKIVYINLNRRKDRNEHIKKLIKKHNLDNVAERFEAIDGRKLDLNNLDRKIISQKAINDAIENKQLYTTMTVGGIGCALSHYNVYKKIVNEKIQRCLILEDDIEIIDDFNSKCEMLDNILKTTGESNFDIFLLGYHNSSLPKAEIYKNYDLVKFTNLYGLFGYIVSYEGAVKLLENIFPLDMQIDSEISNNSDKINIIGLLPSDKLILSEPSSIYTKFGTDIQVYNGVNEIQENNIWMYLFYLSCIILIMYILYMVYKFSINYKKRY